MNTKPNLLDSFTYLGELIKVEWFEADSINNFPDIVWQQVYAITNVDGRVGLVYDATGTSNLPGGKTEDGETIEQTLKREIVEEMNYAVVDWRPLGYQRLTNPAGDSVYQVRVYAKIEKIGDFIADIGGGVIGHKFVDLAQLNNEIDYGKVGLRMIEMVAPDFKSPES
jgi:ADP-ribose pyrophosphatase YjhB (NUDIX family)